MKYRSDAQPSVRLPAVAGPRPSQASGLTALAGRLGSGLLRAAAAMALLALAPGCAPMDEAEPHAALERIGETGYPLDDVLRLNQLQAKGTHNSYHMMSIPVPPWQYTHLPMDQQLATQGVRALEMDVHFDAKQNRLEVYHVWMVDQKTTCKVFSDCLKAIKGWSDANPGHHPLFIQIEPKDFSAPVSSESFFNKLEDEILAVWPEERLITPDEVKGGYPDLATAAESGNWPTLGESRGRILFFLDDSSELTDYYTYGGTSLDGRLIFADGGFGDPWTAIMILNDPLEQNAEIEVAVQSGYLVRTRADSDGNEARANDTTRRDMAFESGAQIISTDFPAPVSNTDYWVQIPGGTPSRCNPLIAPSNCTSAAIEDPSLLAQP